MIGNLAAFWRLLLNEILDWIHTCPEETCAR